SRPGRENPGASRPVYPRNVGQATGRASARLRDRAGRLEAGQHIRAHFFHMPEARPQILVVDDDPDILEALSEILEAEGYEVDRARHGQEALARIEQRRPDLILLDLMMPVMD